MKDGKKIYNQLNCLLLLITAFAVIAIIYEEGFKKELEDNYSLHVIYLATILIGAFFIAGRYGIKKFKPAIHILPFDLFILLLVFLIFVNFEGLRFIQFLSNDILLKFTVLLIFFRELSALQVNFKWNIINPAQLFILSFLLMIIAGCLFLMLPNATHSGISLIDALFTSTSAVCVTGLIVVDTGSYFTLFGQIVIIVLVQAGGIGIMTFASYFGYFFKGSSSFKKELLIKELTWPGKLGDVFTTLKRIIIITFFIETIGAFLIFHNLDIQLMPNYSERLFFSVFHSISGYCNAGFSTLTNSLFENSFRFNYPLHIIIAILFITGGLGFPIIFNLLKYLKNKIKNIFFHLFRIKHTHLPWILNINSRIVLVTTLILIIIGTIHFFIFEYNNTLSEHNLLGKIVTSFFGAVTPRTAGFNTTDTAGLAIPTVLMLLFLMWVGASPASTGGGIKTSTLTLAFLNFFSISRGKKRLEIFSREISQVSVNRAFSIIFLSILVISASFFGISYFERNTNLLDVFFECVSAFGTVGLSRGITASLSSYSKFILILTMFVGRVGILTILIALLKKVTRYKYRYPTEDLLIN